MIPPMWSWLTRKTDGAEGQALLRRLRDSYPVYAAPHPYRRDGQMLSLDQAQANLDYLLAMRPERLRIVAECLRAEAGVDARAALAGADPGPLLAGLHGWAQQALPALRRAASGLARPEVWLASERRGPEIVYSLLMDLALLLAELILLSRPAFQWALDLDEGNLLDGMDSPRRPLLQWAPMLGATGATGATGSATAAAPPVQIDIESIVVGRFFHPETAEYTVMDGWAVLVKDASSGAYERVF